MEPRQTPVPEVPQAPAVSAPPILTSAVRTALQFLWSVVIGWPILREVLPKDVPPAVYAVALALVLAALVAVQRWMETRPAGTPGGQALRWLARLMMLFLNRQPAGTVPVTGTQPVALTGVPDPYDRYRAGLINPDTGRRSSLLDNGYTPEPPAGYPHE